MLLVTIELVPSGFGPMSRKIASMRISNLSDLADISDYCIEATESANPLTQKPSRTTECIVREHQRRQSVWALLKRACEEVITSESFEP
ncbi:hypothetical protein ACVWWO_005203 [Bradyrhizobium sp. F1.13.1]